jgi:flagellar assembly protein FliH
MTQLRRHILDAAEPQLVALACAIGERIAGRELGSDPELVVAWAREAVEQLANDGSVVVAISPDIAATLREVAWNSVRSPSVAVETDATLGAGSCEVRWSSSSTDVSLASRAEAVRREVVGSTA